MQKFCYISRMEFRWLNFLFSNIFMPLIRRCEMYTKDWTIFPGFETVLFPGWLILLSFVKFPRFLISCSVALCFLTSPECQILIPSGNTVKMRDFRTVTNGCIQTCSSAVTKLGGPIYSELYFASAGSRRMLLPSCRAVPYTRFTVALYKKHTV
jgi:hypothetical protein